MALRAVGLEAAAHLTSAMIAELSVRYGDDGATPAEPAEFLAPQGIFLIGTVDGVDVACGGLRPHGPTIGEVKRMYVDPSHRGQGYARTLLRGLVDHARGRDLEAVWLETGTLQPEAIALYESEGFRPIPHYEGHDDAYSRCFGLALR